MIAQSPLTRELHGRRHVLVDSGANEGMWSILAGAHGGHRHGGGASRVPNPGRYLGLPRAGHNLDTKI